MRNRIVLVCAILLTVFALTSGCKRAEEAGEPQSSPPAGGVAGPAHVGSPAKQHPVPTAVPAPATTPRPETTSRAAPAEKTGAGDSVFIVRFDSASMENGVPPGWELDRKCGTSSMKIEEVGSLCLHLTCDSESSFGIKRSARVDIMEYPFLNWRWKVNRLPKGGDVRQPATDDQALQIYVAFTATGWPEKLNTPILGYIWDNETPKGWMGRSTQIGGSLLRYIVVRNKSDRIGEWYREKRNIYEDYRELFKDVKEGQPPGPAKGIELYINAQHTGSSAESYICEVYFSKS